MSDQPASTTQTDATGAIWLRRTVLTVAGGVLMLLGLLLLSPTSSAHADSLLPIDLPVATPAPEQPAPAPILFQLVPPVTDVVHPVTEIVEPVAAPIDTALTPLTEPVTAAAVPVVAPVVETVQPVIDAVSPVVAEAATAVAPIAEPVVDTVAPIVELATDTVAPVVDQIAPIVTPAVTEVVAPALHDIVAPVVDQVADRVITPAVAPIVEVAAPVVEQTTAPNSNTPTAVESIPASQAPKTVDIGEFGAFAAASTEIDQVVPSASGATPDTATVAVPDSGAAVDTTADTSPVRPLAPIGATGILPIPVAPTSGSGPASGGGSDNPTTSQIFAVVPAVPSTGGTGSWVVADDPFGWHTNAALAVIERPG